MDGGYSKDGGYPEDGEYPEVGEYPGFKVRASPSLFNMQVFQFMP